MFIIWNADMARPVRKGRKFAFLDAARIADALEIKFGFHYTLIPANG